jgi:hypothetical protein
MTMACAEGESYQTVADWRSEHERFWRKEVFPDWAGDVRNHSATTRVESSSTRGHPHILRAARVRLTH